jgi:hypothetical protein
MAMPQCGQKPAPGSMGPPQAGQGVLVEGGCHEKLPLARIWPEM